MGLATNLGHGEEKNTREKTQIHSSVNYLSCTKFSVYFYLSFLADMFLKVQVKDQHILIYFLFI